MDWKLGRLGKITSGEFKNHFVKIEEAPERNGELFVLRSRTTDLKDGWFDDWLKSKEDLEAYFRETGWTIEWIE